MPIPYSDALRFIHTNWRNYIVHGFPVVSLLLYSIVYLASCLELCSSYVGLILASHWDNSIMVGRVFDERSVRGMLPTN